MATAGGSRASRLLLPVLLFVVGRALFLWGDRQGPGRPSYEDTTSTDVQLYAQYVWEYNLGRKHGLSFHETRARLVQRRIHELSVPLGHAPPLEEFENIEYPPLAVELLRVPAVWMKQPPGDPPSSRAFEQNYFPAYRLAMAVVDACLAVLVWLLIQRLYAGEAPAVRVERMSAYLLATLALWPILYERLDLVLGFLIALALALLVSRRHFLWSFLALALAVNYKLVPIIFLPIWAIGTLPADMARQASRARLLVQVGWRALLGLALTVVLFVPFYFRSGLRALGFYPYHEARGIEINTVYSSVLMLLHLLGSPLEVYYSHNSINVRSALSPALLTLAPFLAGGFLLAALVLFIVHVRGLLARANDSSDSITLAQRSPADFAGYVLLFLMLFMMTNKVFSPQYLLWIAPLVPLVPLPARGRRLFLWGFVLTALWTTYLFPFRFFTDVAVRDATGQFAPPTPLGVLLVVGRNLMLVALTAVLGWHLVRWRGRPLTPSTASAPG